MLWLLIILTFILTAIISIFGEQEKKRLKKEHQEIDKILNNKDMKIDRKVNK